jgi:hypothetical protein
MASTASVSAPSVPDSASDGKAARGVAPRGGHAEFEPASDRSDPVELLERQARTRVPELVPIRSGRMLASPFAFYRGAAAAGPGTDAGRCRPSARRARSRSATGTVSG